MPELPEVETIAGYLRGGTGDAPGLIGRVASSSELFWERSLATPSLAEVNHRLPGQTLNTIDRRGKFLMFHFDRDHLLIHLRMSGDAVSEYGEEKRSKAGQNTHARFILNFEDGVRLVFIDPRKFGRLWLVEDPLDVVGSLGPEPFDPSLSVEAFHRRLTTRQRLLKPLLLDQTFLAGLGNIYSDEALNLACLHPLQLSSQLTVSNAGVLLDAIRVVLKQAIVTHGASIDWVYRGGDFQNYFRVYQRTGEPCPNCGTPVERIRVGQRSTHYCPNCQRL